MIVSTPSASASLYKQIYRVVREVPHGRVVTYGQIAAMVGCTPRQAGYAMAACQEDDVPWHRVINSKGMVSPRRGGDGEANVQRALLEAEGIEFDSQGKVDLAQVLWVAFDSSSSDAEKQP